MQPLGRPPATAGAGFLFGGALIVLLAVLTIESLYLSEEQLWLLALWLTWGSGAVWVFIRRSFSPPALGLLAIMLFFVIVPGTIDVASGHTVLAGVDYSPGTIAALEISVAAQLGLNTGIIVAQLIRAREADLHRVSVAVSGGQLIRLSAACICISATAFALLVVTSGANLGLYVAIVGTSRYGDFFTSSLGTASGYLGSITGVAGGCVLVAALWKTTPLKRRRPLLLLLLAILAGGFLIASGQRARLIVPVIAAGLLWLKTRSGRRTPALRTLSVVLILGVITFGALIETARGGSGSSITAATVVSAEFGAGADQFAPLAGLAQTIPANQDYLLGSSYAEALYFPIPRNLWPGKPEEAIVTVIGRFADISNGTSFLEYGELYANFGIAGVVIGCFAFAGLVELVWIRFARRTDGKGLFIYPAVLAILLQVFTRGYAVSQLAGFLGFLLGALLLQRTLKVDVSQIGDSAAPLVAESARARGQRQ